VAGSYGIPERAFVHSMYFTFLMFETKDGSNILTDKNLETINDINTTSKKFEGFERVCKAESITDKTCSKK
jgi:hypothetical protein